MTHSADVRLWLALSGVRYALSRVTPRAVEFPTRVTLPAGAGELVVSVDGDEQRRAVAFRGVNGRRCGGIR